MDVDDDEKEFGQANVGVALGLRKPCDVEPADEGAEGFDLNSVQGSVLTGFQMATDRGPLCMNP